MRSRGLTLIELLIALTMIVVLTFALFGGYVRAIGYDRTLRADRAEILDRQQFEDRIADLLKRAYVSADAADTASYFIAGAATQTPDQSGTQLPSGSTTDSITFCILGGRVPSVLLASEDDFETNNERFGPSGGVSEVSLSLTPIGEGANGKDGLFLRTQTPADGDPSQGGMEEVLNEHVSEISFELFDGTQWIQDWDTRTQSVRRLPSAVRVTYRFQDDQADHILIVQLPYSDVTPDNPVTETTG